MHYEKFMGIYYLKDADHIIYEGAEVAICFDGNSAGSVLHKHGNPELVKEWYENTRILFRSKGFEQEAKDLVYISSPLWPVEELNKCIHNTGYAGKLAERLGELEIHPPRFQILSSREIHFTEPLATFQVKGVGWRLKNGSSNPDDAQEKECQFEFYSKEEEGGFRDILHIRGGVTGWEAWNLDVGILVAPELPYWSACAGGMGWDAFRITKEEMRRVLEEYLKVRKLHITISVPDDPWDAEVINIEENPKGGFTIYHEGEDHV